MCVLCPGIPPTKYHYIDDLVVILPQNVWEYLYNRSAVNWFGPVCNILSVSHCPFIPEPKILLELMHFWCLIFCCTFHLYFLLKHFQNE